MSWAADEWKDDLSHRARQKVEQLVAQVEKQKKELDQKQFKLDSLEQVLQKEKKKFDDERAQVSTLKRETQSLAETCNDLDQKCQKLAADLQCKENHINALNGQMAYTKKSLEAETNKVIQLQHQVERFEKDHGGSNEKYEKLALDHSKLQQLSNHQKEECSALRSECNLLKQKLSDLEKVNAEAQSVVMSLKMQLKDFQSAKDVEFRNLNTSLKAEQERVKVLERKNMEDVESLKRAFEQKDKEFNNLLSDFRTKEDKLNSAIKTMQTEIHNLKDALGTKSAQEANSRVKLEQEIREMKCVIEGKEDETRKLQKDMTFLRDSLTNAQRLTESLKSEIREKDLLLEQLRETLESVKKESEQKILKIENQNQDAEFRMISICANLDAISSQKKELEGEIERKEAVLQELTDDLNSFREDKTVAEDTILKLENEKQKLFSNINELKAEIHNLKLENENQKQELQEVKSMFEGKDKEFDMVQLELCYSRDGLATTQKLFESLQINYTEKEENLVRLQVEYNKMETSLEDKIEKLNMEINTLKDSVESLMVDLKSARVQKEELEKNLANTNAEMKDTKEELNNSLREKLHLENTLKNIGKENEMLHQLSVKNKEELESLRVEKDKSDQLVINIKIDLKRAEEELGTLQQAMVSLRHYTDNTKGRLDELQNEKNTLELTCKRSKDEIDGLNYQIKEAKEVDEKRQESLHKLQLAFQSFKEESYSKSKEDSEMITGLKAELEESKNVIAGQQHTIEQLTDELSHIKNNLDTTHEQLRKTSAELENTFCNFSQLKNDSDIAAQQFELERAQYKAEVIKFQQMKSDMMVDLDRLNSQKNEIEKQLESESLKLKESIEICEKMVFEKENLEHRLACVEHERQELLKKNDQLNEELISLKAGKADMEQTLRENEHRLEMATDSNNGLSNQLAKSQEEVKASKEMVETLKTEQSDLSCQLKILENEMEEVKLKLAESHNLLEKEQIRIIQVHKEYQAFKDDVHAKAVEESKSQAELSLELDELKNITEGKEREISQLKEENCHLLEMHEKTQLLLETTKAKLGDTELAVTLLQNNLEVTKFNLETEISHQGKENTLLQDRIDSLLRDVDCMKKELEDAQDKYNIVCLQLKENKEFSEKLFSEKEELEKYLSHNDDEKQDLLKKLDLNNNDLVSLKNEKAELEQRLNQEIFKLETASTDLTDLSEQLEEAENKCKVFNEMLDKVKAEKIEHECQIKKLETCVEDLTFSLEESRVHQDKQQHNYSELQAKFQKYKDDANVRSMEDSQTKVILTQEVEELKNIINGKDEIIDQLNNEMAHTKDVLEKTQSILDETRSKLKDNDITLRQVQSDSEAMQLNLEARMSGQENENRSLQDKINCLLGDKECLQKQLKETQDNYNCACQKLKEVEESLEKLSSEKENLEKCLNHKDEERQGLLNKLDGSDNLLVSLKTEKAELEQNLSQALFRLETSSTDLTDLSQQLEEAETKYKFFNEMLDKVNAEKTEHECQIRKLERNVEDLTFSLEESRVHQDKQQNDYSELQAKFQNYKDDVNVKSMEETQTKVNLTREVEELKNIINGKDEIIEQLNNEMAHTKDVLEKTQSLLDETRSKLKDNEITLRQVQSDSEAIQLNLEARMSGQENENRSLQDKINCLLGDMECLQKQFKETQDNYNCACQKLKEVAESLEKLSSEKENLEKCLNHKDQEKQDLLQKLDGSDNLLVSLKTEKAELDQNLSQALFRLETSSTDLTDLSNQLEEAENKCKVFNEMLDKVNAEKTEHECQIRKLERNVEDLTFSLEESRVHQDKQQNDYSELQAKFQNYKDDANVRSVEETQTKVILTQKVEELINIIAGKDEIIGQLNNEMMYSKDTTEKTQLLLDETKSKLKDSEMSLNQVQTDSEAAKLNLETKTCQQEKEIKALQDHINCLLRDMEGLKKMLEDAQDKHNSECLNLKESKETCEKLATEKEELKKCLSHKDQEKQDLLKKLDHANDDLVSLKTEKTDLDHSLSQALFKLETTSADILDLNKQLEEAENKCKVLSEMLDRVNAEKTELDCHVKTLERNIEDLNFCSDESRVSQEKQQHDYSQLQADFQKYKDDVNIRSMEETQTKVILNQELEELRNIIDGKDEVIQQLNNEITRIKDEMGEKNIMLDILRGELSTIDASFKLLETDSNARQLELEEQIVKHKNEIEVLQDKCNNISSDLDNLTHLKEDLMDKLEEKSLKLKDSISALEQLTIENVEISKKIEKKEMDNQECLEKLDLLEKQLSLMKMETADKKVTLGETEFRLETALEDLKALNNQYEQLLDASKIKSDNIEELVLQKSELQSQLMKVEHDVEELQTQLKEGSRKRQELEKCNTRLQTELSILKDKTSHSHAESAEICARQAQEIEELKNVKEGKEREILHMLEELQHKEEKIQGTLDKLEDITKHKSNLENELSNFQTQLKEKTFDMEQEIWNLQNNLKNLEEQFQKKEKECELIKENESMLSYKLGEGENKLLEMQADLEEVNHKRIFLEKHIEVLEKDKEEITLLEEILRKKINDIETENTRTRQLVGELQNVVEEKDEALSKLYLELKDASEKIEKMQNQLDLSKQDWKEKDSTLIEIQAELEDTQIKYQEDIRVLQKDKSHLEKKLEKLQTENSMLSSEQNERDIKLSRTIDQLTEKNADVDRLMNEKTGLEQQILLEDKNQAELMDKLFQVKAEFEDKKAQIIMLEQKLNETKFELDTAHSSIQFNNAKIEEAQSVVAGLKEQLENSLQNNQQLKMSKLELEKEIEELRFKLIDAENSGNKLENKVGNIQQEMGDLKDSCSQKNLEVCHIKAELNNEISELKSILGSKENALADLTAELEHLKDNLETKENQVVTLNDNISSLLVEKAALQKELNEIRTDIREKETENYKLKCKIETIDAELQEAKDVLEKKTKELEDTHIEIACLKTNVELETISFGESLQKAGVQNEYLTNKVSELQLELDRAKNENDDVCSKLSAKKTKLTQQTEDLEQMVAEKDSLCQEIMRLEKELEQYRQTVMSFSPELLASKDEIRSLQHKLKEINNEAEMLKESKALLEKNLEKVDIDHKAAKERLYHLESELVLFEGTVKTLNAELEEKNMYIADINKMKDDLSNSLTLKENERTKLMDVINIAKLNEKELKVMLDKNLEVTPTLLAEKDADIVNVSEEFKDLVEKYDTAQTRIKYLENQVEKMNAELLVLKTDQEELRSQAEERTDLQNEDDKSLKETIVVVSNERNKALVEKEASKICKMEKELEQYIGDLETIRKERDELADKLLGAEEDYCKQGKIVDSLKHELCVLKSDKHNLEGRLEEVECELTKTHTEKCELTENLIALEDQKSELKKDIDKLNAEFSALQAERADFENKLCEAKHDLEEAEAINQSFKDQLQQSDTEYKKLRKQMYDLTSDKEELKAELQKIKVENERISTEMKDVKHELTEPMENRTEENGDLQNKIFNMEHSLLNKCQEIRSLEKEREEMEVEFKTVQLSCHELQKTIESLESEKALLVDEIRDLKGTDSHQQVETERLIAEKLNLEKMLMEKEAETLTLSKNLDESRSQLIEYEEELMQKNRELGTLRSKVEQLSNEYDGLSRESQDRLMQLHDKAVLIQDLRSQLSDQEHKLRISEESLAEWKMRYEQVKTEVHNLREDCAQQGSESELLTADVMEAQNTIKELTTERDRLSQKLNEFTEMWDKLKNEVHESKTESEELRGKLTMLNHDLKESEKERKQADAQVQKLKQELEKLCAEIENLNAEKEDLQDMAESTCMNKMEIEEKLMEVTKELADEKNKSEEMKQNIATLANENKTLSEKSSEAEDLVSVIQMEKCELQNQRKELDNFISSLKDERKILHEKVKSLESTVENFKQFMESLEMENNSLESSKADLLSETQSLNMRIKVLETLATKEQEKNESLSQQQMKWLTEQEFLNGKLDALNAKLLEKEKMCEVSHRQECSLQEENKLLETKIKSLEKKILGTLGHAESDSRARAAESELAKVKLESICLNQRVATQEREKKDLLEKFLQLEDQKAVLEKSKSALQQQLTVASKEKNDLESVIQKLNSALETMRMELQKSELAVSGLEHDLVVLRESRDCLAEELEKQASSHKESHFAWKKDEKEAETKNLNLQSKIMSMKAFMEQLQDQHRMELEESQAGHSRDLEQQKDEHGKIMASREAELQGQIKCLQASMYETQSQLNDTKEKLEEKQRQAGVEGLTQEHSELLKKWESRCARLQSQLSAEKSTVAKLKAQISQMKPNVSPSSSSSSISVTSVTENMNTQVEQLQKNLNETKMELERAEKELSGYMDKCLHLQKDSQKIKEENGDLKTRVKIYYNLYMEQKAIPVNAPKRSSSESVSEDDPKRSRSNSTEGIKQVSVAKSKTPQRSPLSLSRPSRSNEQDNVDEVSFTGATRDKSKSPISNTCYHLLNKTHSTKVTSPEFPKLYSVSKSPDSNISAVTPSEIYTLVKCDKSASSYSTSLSKVSDSVRDGAQYLHSGSISCFSGGLETSSHSSNSSESNILPSTSKSVNPFLTSIVQSKNVKTAASSSFVKTSSSSSGTQGSKVHVDSTKDNETIMGSMESSNLSTSRRLRTRSPSKDDLLLISRQALIKPPPSQPLSTITNSPKKSTISDMKKSDQLPQRCLNFKRSPKLRIQRRTRTDRN